MQFSMSKNLDAPAWAAWEVLGERFGEISDWTETIAESRLEGELGLGAARVCRSAESFGPFAPGEVTERLTDFNRSGRELRYEAIQGIPAFLREAGTHWRVEELDESRSRVTATATLRFAAWASLLALLFPWMMKRPMSAFFGELEQAVKDVAARYRSVA